MGLTPPQPKQPLTTKPSANTNENISKNIEKLSKKLKPISQPIPKQLSVLSSLKTTSMEQSAHLIIQQMTEVIDFLKLPRKISALEIYYYLHKLKKQRKEKKVIEKIEEAIEFFDSTCIRGSSRV